MITKENSLLFLGDVAPYRTYNFRNNCKVVMNLECPITMDGVPATNKIILAARQNHLKNIFSGSILCVNLGNNHILDYGKEGLDSTVSELKRSGIKYFGLNNEIDNNPLILNFNNIKIAFLSAVCDSTSAIFDYEKTNYLNQLNTAEITGMIRDARNLADRVVVYLHWGEEDHSLPTEIEIKSAKELIEGGADIVIGSHAHSPQPVGKYKNGIIAYNLGNFIFPKMDKVPSYFDAGGVPRLIFSHQRMPWNIISWGIMVDMVTMEFRIRKFMQSGRRVLELPFTPYDKFIKLPPEEPGEEYSRRLEKHRRSRRLQLRIADFLHHPHIPQKFLRKL